MSLTQIAKQMSAWETRRIQCVGIDVKVKRLSLTELHEAERLTEACSIGNGQNRHVNDLPRLAWSLVGKWIKDADGNPLAGDDTVEDAKDWPAQLVTELMEAFNTVNTPKAPDPN